MAGGILTTVGVELSKLKEKAVNIQAINNTNKPFFFFPFPNKNSASSRPPQEEQGQRKQAVCHGKEEVKSAPTRTMLVKEEDGLSESTVCLLMDRFVPW